LNPERILQGLAQLELQSNGERITSNQGLKSSDDLLIVNHQSPITKFQQVADYSMPNVSDKVVRIILSYTDYIKRKAYS